jgi:Domain of unknown function (DUF4412)
MRFSSGCTTAGIALFAAAAPLSAQAFEGRIAVKVSSENGSFGEMEYQVRDNKVRVEIPVGGGQSMAVVIDPTNQKMLMLMPAQKTYLERAFTPAAAGRASQQAGARATVTPTGKKETIAGYQCEHFLVTDDDGASVDACLASGLGPFISAPSVNPMAGTVAGSSDWSSKIGKDAFPLEVTKGNTTVMEVTKIEKASLDPSLFVAPDGWKKFDVLNIPGISGMRPPLQR